MKKKFKAIACEIKEINEEERSFLAVASTEDIDRDNDRIMSGGWDLDNFLKNPVVPWAHRYGDPPVAQASEVFVKDGKLMFRPKFASYDEYPFADTIFKLYKGGFLRSFSVGFNPTRHEVVERGKGRGYDFMEQELWEISACTVPSNPNALVAAKAKGVIGEDEFGAAQGVWEKVAEGGPSDAKAMEGRETRGSGPSDAKAMEGRLEALEEQAKGLGLDALIGEIRVLKGDITAIKEALEAGKSKPEKGGTGEAENLDKTESGNRRTGEAENNETETRDKEKTRDEDVIETVGEAVKAALAKADIGTIIDKRVKYHMGIVE